MTEWQPLRTVPDNRELLFGWQGGYTDKGVMFRRDWASEPEYRFINTSLGPEDALPTHWLDTPPVPEE